MNNGHKLIVRRDAVWREIDDEVIIMTPDETAVYTLNDVGGRIWNLIAEGLKLDEIVNSIKSEYTNGSSDIEQDVNTYIEQLKQLQLVEVE